MCSLHYLLLLLLLLVVVLLLPLAISPYPPYHPIYMYFHTYKVDHF